MQKFKKVIKWTSISVGVLIVFIIVLGSILPKSQVINQEKVSDIQTAPTDTLASSVVEQSQPVVAEKPTLTTDTKPAEKTTTPPTTSSKSQSTAPAKSTSYKVVDVVDGDTVKVSINGTTETLRIIGINTPETVDPRKPVECFGKEASNKATELLSGKSVTLEADASQGERDKYGRLLRYVFMADGTDYGEYMIVNGYAYEYTYNTPYKYQSLYKAAQAQAEYKKAGLWSPNTCSGSKTDTTPATTTTASGNYYTSSYSTSKYYYPVSCDGWKSLTPQYLKSFDTLGSLLATYPNRTLSPSCQ